MPIRLSPFSNLDTAARWLAERTGEQWCPRDLLDLAHGLRLYVWLDFNPMHPELFGDRTEGFVAPICFAGDSNRLAFDGGSGALTMTFLPDGRVVRFKPGVAFSAEAVRVDRDSLKHLANKRKPEGETSEARRERLRTILRDEYGKNPRGALNRAAAKEKVKRQTFTDAFGKGATVNAILRGEV